MSKESDMEKNTGGKTCAMSSLALSALVSVLMLLLMVTVGCGYEKRIHIWAVFHASAWNASRDAFVFARGYQIYKAPKGLSRFPDGGTSKVIHQSISFYLYDVKSGKISRIAYYNNTPKCTLKQFWDIDIIWEKDVIFSSIKTKEWNREKKKYLAVDMGGFSYDIENNIKKDITAKESISSKGTGIKAGGEKRSSMALSSKEIQGYTKAVSIAEWGINPLDFCRLSNRQYIKDIMTLSGDQDYRNAVIEHLGSDLGPDKIRNILESFNRRMEMLKKKDRYKYMKYKYSIEEIKRRLEILLDKP